MPRVRLRLDPVGLEYTIVAGDLLSCCSRVELSGGDLVLVDESAEDLFAADLVLGGLTSEYRVAA
jgi:hypothetical protein